MSEHNKYVPTKRKHSKFPDGCAKKPKTEEKAKEQTYLKPKICK